MKVRAAWIKAMAMFLVAVMNLTILLNIVGENNVQADSTAHKVTLYSTTYDSDGDSKISDTYGESPISDIGGTVSVNKPTASYGEQVTVTATPNSGYELRSIDWVSSDRRSWYQLSNTSPATFSMGDDDCCIDVVFKKIPADPTEHKVTITTNGLGDAYASVEKGIEGTRVILYATPNLGYRLKEWQVVSGGVTISGNSFNIHSTDVVIKAVFEEASAHSVHLYSTTYDSDGNTEISTTHGESSISDVGGTVSVSKATAFLGEKVNIYATPNSGYELGSIHWVRADWRSGYQLGTSSPVSFTMEDNECNITVFFQRKSHDNYDKKNRDNTCLGTSGIKNPDIPNSPNDEWKGSYVYFGSFDAGKGKTPIKFRVLNSNETAFGTSTLFLDSDKILVFKSFDDSSNEFDSSDIQYYLGNSFQHSAFTASESYAIAESEVSGRPFNEDIPSWVTYDYTGYVWLDQNEIFLLDIEDVFNSAYGYFASEGPNVSEGENRTKRDVLNGERDVWWLRSTHKRSSSAVGMVRPDGSVYYNYSTYSLGIAPALNVKLSDILFSTAVNGKLGETGTEYKLTIIDDSVNFKLDSGKEVTVSGSQVTIPNTSSGTSRNSVLILDKEYGTEGAKIQYYGMLDPYGSFDLSASGLDVYDWGTKYFVYVLGEINDGDQETDYACAPIKVDAPAKCKVTFNTNGVGTAPTVQAVFKGFKAAAPAAPSASGYTFGGWYKDPACTTAYDFDSAVISDITLYAKWTAIPVTATPTPVPTKAPSDSGTTPVPTSASSVVLSLNKSSDSIICGKTDTLKATLTGATGKITWSSSDKKVATVDSNGKVTAKMAGTVTITATAAGKSATCTVTGLYKDVTKTKDFWFAPTNYLTAAGVVKGYDKQTKFKPANMCTRAQMVTFIWRLMGEPAPKSKTCKFKDVKEKDYFYKACIWGNENKIVEGYKDGTFGPQIVCARKHAVTFLWRLAGQPKPKTTKNPFKDVKKTDYFYKATLWASEKKILAGYSDGTFKPNGDCLRRQMVTFLYKYDKFINGKG